MADAYGHAAHEAGVRKGAVVLERQRLRSGTVFHYGAQVEKKDTVGTMPERHGSVYPSCAVAREGVPHRGTAARTGQWGPTLSASDGSFRTE